MNTVVPSRRVAVSLLFEVSIVTPAKGDLGWLLQLMLPIHNQAGMATLKPEAPANLQGTR